MRPLVGIVADDLTGAADTAVAFHAAGMSAVVSWADRHVDGGWTAIAGAVLAIDTRSRAADAGYARAITREFVSVFRQEGVATLYKKVDSTLRGHIGAEVRGVMDAWHPDCLAVVAPAFPDTGRTTIDGIQCLHGVPLASCPSVPALFEEAGISTRRADLATVRSTAFESILLDCRQQATGALVCDGETNDDLRAIARAGVRFGRAIVWVGSGGLAHAVAAELAGTGRRARPRTASVSGPLLIVVGSRSDVARAQADEVQATGVRRVVVPVEALANGSVAAAAELATNIAVHLRTGEDVLITPGPGEGADDSRLMVRLGELLRPCIPVVGGLILTGGDAAVGVLDAWGATALRLVEEIDPGVVLSETIGPRVLPVVTKAGSFGDRGTLTRARERLSRPDL
jgi:uncharacterized protein YgbK (DUF1537 family)